MIERFFTPSEIISMMEDNDMNIPDETTCKILWQMMRDGEPNLPADLQLSVRAAVKGAIKDGLDPYDTVVDMLQATIVKFVEYQRSVVICAQASRHG